MSEHLRATLEYQVTTYSSSGSSSHSGLAFQYELSQIIAPWGQVRSLRRSAKVASGDQSNGVYRLGTRPTESVKRFQ